MLSLGVVTVAIDAHAATVEEQAETLKRKGDAALDAGNPADALENYEAAYKLVPDMRILYNKGRALQSLGRYAEALGAIETFAKSAPTEIRSKVPKLAELLAELRNHVTQLSVS